MLGFQYQINFDQQKDGDRVAEFDGMRVYIDDFSLPYIAGTTLDFVEGLHGAGFRFDNPKPAAPAVAGHRSAPERISDLYTSAAQVIA